MKTAPSLVTITGADNNTSIEQMVKMSQENSNLEWAILVNLAKPGTARNPDSLWRNQFLQQAKAFPKAAHLCGKETFQVLLKNDEQTQKLLSELALYDRVQCNINSKSDDFDDVQVATVWSMLLDAGIKVIIQYQERKKNLVHAFMQILQEQDRLWMVEILHDSSCGTGQTPEKWAEPLSFAEVANGWAGGLTPENVFTSLQDISTKAEGALPYWIDMETGVRTLKDLDLEKVQMVLDNVKTFSIWPYGVKVKEEIPDELFPR